MHRHALPFPLIRKKVAMARCLTKAFSSCYPRDHPKRVFSSSSLNRRDGERDNGKAGNVARYNSQSRGDSSHYQSYIEAMDAISLEKVASASAFFQPQPGGVLVDVGMASGTSTALLARLFPHAQVIGVDVNPQMVALATRRYPQSIYPNLQFRLDDGKTLESFAELTGRIDGFFCCSSLHHVTSYGGYDAERAQRALARQATLLADGGVLVVRDFAKPEEQRVILELRDSAPAASPGMPSTDRPSDADLLVRFSTEARSLAPVAERGFPLCELPPTQPGWRRFRLFYTDATEFVRRMDYYEDWAVELQEEYGYLSQRQFENTFAGLGLRVMLSGPLHNRWIVRHRYHGRFRLFGLHVGPQGEGQEDCLVDLGYPPTNYLVAAEKVSGGKGRQLSLSRHLPLAQPTPYLQLRTYKHRETQRLYDVVRRPSDVTDVIPYYYADDSPTLFVAAKHGYPRPLLCLHDGGAAPLDGKHYSGYITEALATAAEDDAAQPVGAILAQRCGLPADCCDEKSEQVLYGAYFPSPGGLAERVASKAVRLRPGHGLDGRGRPMAAGVSGFTESGWVRGYDARQLLLSAQTGVLVEARLEMNLYRLLHLLDHPMPPWLGEKLALTPAKPPSTITHLADLLRERETRSCFAEVTRETSTDGFLEIRRATFAELGGPVGSQSTLEYVVPRYHSANTLLTLPITAVAKRATAATATDAKNCELYIGLEVRELPAPQLYARGGDGRFSCRLLTLPACRLPTSVTTVIELERFLHQRYTVAGRRVARYATLGEKFFPSIGVTAEQVYPYVIALDAEEDGATVAADSLAWVPAQELFSQMHQLEDGHLLIALARLQHMLSAGV